MAAQSAAVAPAAPALSPITDDSSHEEVGAFLRNLCQKVSGLKGDLDLSEFQNVGGFKLLRISKEHILAHFQKANPTQEARDLAELAHILYNTLHEAYEMHAAVGRVGSIQERVASAMQMHCTPKEQWKKKLRRSLDHAPADPLNPYRLGERFSFVNREAECVLMLKTLYANECLRVEPDGTFERCKREFKVPLTAGLSGMGKTRFAREFMLQLARGAATSGDEQLVYESLKTAAAPLAAMLNPDSPPVDFVDELIRASFEGRNIRIACDEWSGALSKGLLAHVVLTEWAKPHLKTNNDDTSALCKSLEELAKDLTLDEVVALVMKDCPNGALFINLDECHALLSKGGEGSKIFGEMLRSMIGLVLNRKYRLFFTVTGVSTIALADAIGKSSARAAGIYLAPLEYRHLVEIIDAFFGTAEDGTHIFDQGVPAALAAMLYRIGGNPCHLEYFLKYFFVVKGLELHTVRSMLTSPLCLKNLSALSAALEYAQTMAVGATTKELMNSLYSLVVSGLGVSPTLKVPPAIGVDNIAKAQDSGLVYLKPLESSASGQPTVVTVHMPPLTVRRNTGQKTKPSVGVLDDPNFVMSSTYNESHPLYSTMLKLEAAHLAEKQYLRLSDLFGPNTGFEDIEVCVPANCEVRSLSQRCESEMEIKALLSYKEKAFLNARNASFADGFVVLDTRRNKLVVYFQCKQSITTRRQRLTGPPPAPLGAAACDQVNTEFKKIKKLVRGWSRVFVYVTDEDIKAPLPDNLRGTVWVCDHKQHEQLFGKDLATLRNFCVAEERSREDSNALDALGVLVSRENPCLPFRPPCATAPAPMAAIAEGASSPPKPSRPKRHAAQLPIARKAGRTED
eukprot:m.70021 g.70021  ORF g.70021 m.70021 type:complete len:853 (+) comp7569_c0_seq5:100-2658(+)